METIKNKIDFTVIFSVTNANPNGDPLNGNRPRETYDGFGEMSDVCIKRKIRNRLQDMGERIFVQMDERSDDGFKSLSERASKNALIKAASKDKSAYAKAACEQWFDVRAFGQVFAFQSGSDKVSGVSIGVRGPVSIHQAISVDPVDIETLQITKSVNSEPGDGKSSDTMGSKHRINFGIYRFDGSICCQLAEKTSFSEQDAEKILEALKTLFENDASSARPDGSLEVCRVFWWKHNCATGQYSSAKVHRSVHIHSTSDEARSFDKYEITLDELPGLQPEVYELF
ncbi:MAG: type I-C CRISPR-associated protein Cas7/Csd2 [Oscillospiraceae bacterium]